MRGVGVVDVSEERRKKRRAGDSRLTVADREMLTRITTGDLADEFQFALDTQLVADPLLGGHDDDHAI